MESKSQVQTTRKEKNMVKTAMSFYGKQKKGKKKMMSFSQEVKNELLLKEKLSNGEIMSELSSVIMICGALTFQNKNTKISIETENNPLVRKLFVSIKKLYSYEAKIQFIEKGQIRKKNRYKVLIEDDKTVGKILEDMNLDSISLAFLTPNINKNPVRGPGTSEASASWRWRR